MVTVGYDQARRKLLPVDGPGEWDSDTNHPDVDPSEAPSG